MFLYNIVNSQLCSHLHPCENLCLAAENHIQNQASESRSFNDNKAYLATYTLFTIVFDDDLVMLEAI